MGEHFVEGIWDQIKELGNLWAFDPRTAVGPVLHTGLIRGSMEPSGEPGPAP